MPAVSQYFVEDLSEVFVDANIHIYLPLAARESLPRPLPILARRVHTTIPYRQNHALQRPPTSHLSTSTRHLYSVAESDLSNL